MTQERSLPRNKGEREGAPGLKKEGQQKRGSTDFRLSRSPDLIHLSPPYSFEELGGNRGKSKSTIIKLGRITNITTYLEELTGLLFTSYQITHHFNSHECFK